MITRTAAEVHAFACNHCGRCCEKILVHLKAPTYYTHGTFGMMLTPRERGLFPNVEPMWRADSEVLAYQMPVEPCPHWVARRCVIHDKRPLACRAYPVWWEFVWRVDTRCPQVAAGPGQTVGMFSEQIRAAHAIMRFQRWLYATHHNLEYFDLAERRWLCLTSTPTATAR